MLTVGIAPKGQSVRSKRVAATIQSLLDANWRTSESQPGVDSHVNAQWIMMLDCVEQQTKNMSVEHDSQAELQNESPSLCSACQNPKQGLIQQWNFMLRAR